MRSRQGNCTNNNTSIDLNEIPIETTIILHSNIVNQPIKDPPHTHTPKRNNPKPIPASSNTRKWADSDKISPHPTSSTHEPSIPNNHVTPWHYPCPTIPKREPNQNTLHSWKPTRHTTHDNPNPTFDLSPYMSKMTLKKTECMEEHPRAKKIKGKEEGQRGNELQKGRATGKEKMSLRRSVVRAKFGRKKMIDKWSKGGSIQMEFNDENGSGVCSEIATHTQWVYCPGMVRVWGLLWQFTT